jgi:hypothetical protein
MNTEHTSLKHFLENIFCDEKYTLHHSLHRINIRDHLPGLIEQSGLVLAGPTQLSRGIIPKHCCHAPTLFIGQKGLQTSLHYDRAMDVYSDPYLQENDVGRNNLFFVLSGKRKFYLFPPECLDHLSPLKHTPWPNTSQSTTFIHSIYNNCSADDEIQQIDFIEKSPFPEMAKAWPYRVEVTVQAEEALFIPARFWYCNEILESGSTINWWFHTDYQKLKIKHSLEESHNHLNGGDYDHHYTHNQTGCLIS